MACKHVGFGEPAVVAAGLRGVSDLATQPDCAVVMFFRLISPVAEGFFRFILAYIMITASCALSTNGQAIQPVWGFADLHTHPAAHLAFGADNDGNLEFFGGSRA